MGFFSSLCRTISSRSAELLYPNAANEDREALQEVLIDVPEESLADRESSDQPLESKSSSIQLHAEHGRSRYGVISCTINRVPTPLRILFFDFKGGRPVMRIEDIHIPARKVADAISSTTKCDRTIFWRWFRGEEFRVASSCDSLLLIQLWAEDSLNYPGPCRIFVCNPMSGSYYKLLPSPPGERPGFHYNNYTMIYDPLVKKYKIFVISERRCIVFEFGLDEEEDESASWKEISISQCSVADGDLLSSVFVGGKLHYLIWKLQILYCPERKYSWTASMLSFDTTTEKFSYIDQFPELPSRSSCAGMDYASARMFYSMNHISDGKYELWVLRDLGNPVWVKSHPEIDFQSAYDSYFPKSWWSFLVDDPPLYKDMNPLGVDDEDRKLMTISRGGILAYDLVHNEWDGIKYDSTRTWRENLVYLVP